MMMKTKVYTKLLKLTILENGFNHCFQKIVKKHIFQDLRVFLAVISNDERTLACVRSSIAFLRRSRCLSQINWGQYLQAFISSVPHSAHESSKITAPSVFKVLMLLYYITLFEDAVHEKPLISSCSQKSTFISYILKRTTKLWSALARAAKSPQLDTLVVPILLLIPKELFPVLKNRNQSFFLFKQLVRMSHKMGAIHNGEAIENAVWNRPNTLRAALQLAT